MGNNKTDQNPKVLFFDIDGTLLRSGGAGKRSMEKALIKIYGIENGFRGIEMMGRTDPSILRSVLTNHGLEWEENVIEKYKEAYFKFLRDEIDVPNSEKRLCPGIRELLERLSRKSDIFIGLLTGNWKTSGYLKLRHFKIDTYFKTGAFADDSEIREELVPIAIERIERQIGHKINKSQIYVIGDTPKDIRSARPHGVKTVGVATGIHSLEELREEGPDYLFEDFSEVDNVIRRLTFE